MSYQLRRLRLHGLITRIPHSHRYRVTDFGFRTALFLSRAHARLVRPGLSATLDPAPPAPTPLAAALQRVDQAIDRIWIHGELAA